jgi:hypothetical protein
VIAINRDAFTLQCRARAANFLRLADFSEAFMTDNWTDEERTQIIEELCRRARVDAEFRSLALKDAAAAIAKVTTRPLPAGITYRFVDNSGPVKTIPLPDAIPETEELSDIELEKIAGGDWTNVVGLH